MSDDPHQEEANVQNEATTNVDGAVKMENDMILPPLILPPLAPPTAEEIENFASSSLAAAVMEAMARQQLQQQQQQQEQFQLQQEQLHHHLQQQQQQIMKSDLHQEMINNAVPPPQLQLQLNQRPAREKRKVNRDLIDDTPSTRQSKRGGSSNQHAQQQPPLPSHPQPLRYNDGLTHFERLKRAYDLSAAEIAAGHAEEEGEGEGEGLTTRHGAGQVDMYAHNPAFQIQLVLKGKAVPKGSERFDGFIKTGVHYEVGDFVFLHAVERNGQPFCGRIVHFAGGDSHMMRVQWLYRPEEIKNKGGEFLSCSDLALSNHYDQVRMESVMGQMQLRLTFQNGLTKFVTTPHDYRHRGFHFNSFVCRYFYDVHRIAMSPITEDLFAVRPIETADHKYLPRRPLHHPNR